jgi:hypothetical protein
VVRTFDDGHGTIYYAVVVDPSATFYPSFLAPGLTPTQLQTISTSHELAEAATNPTGKYGFGWTDRNPLRSTFLDEAAPTTW